MKGEENNGKQEQFEKCLDEVGFGKFQVFTLLVAFFGNIAYIVVTGNTPYILPNAECDLSMNLREKGLLNAITYAGMLSSGFFVGFLSDAFGRKLFLIGCFVMTALCVMVEGTAQNYYTLLVAKFFEGLLLNGTFSANISYISEVIHRSIRDQVMMFVSSFVVAAQICVVLMAWAILPQNWHIEVGQGLIVLHSWNIYLYACAMWSVAACFMYSMLPESPKFLFAHGRHGEALNVLKKMYTINTGKPADSFPYTTLCDKMPEFKTSSEHTDNASPALSWQKQFVEALKGAKQLFLRPLLSIIVLMCSMQLVIMLGSNTMRLWYPQLSTIIESYGQTHNTTHELCVMLDTYMAHHSETVNNIELGRECTPIRSGSETYINSLIMGTALIIPYLISGLAVNLVGKKPLIFVAVTVSCASCIALYWSSSSWGVMLLVTTVVSLTQCGVSIMLTIVVEVFPTTLKSLAVSLLMTSGRIGSLLGIVMFPLMLEYGCMVPFLTIGSMLAGVGLLTLFLPGSEKK